MLKVVQKNEESNDNRVEESTGQRKRFASAILPAWSRKPPRVAEVLPLLYLHGLSSSDFGPALEQFLGSGTSNAAAIPAAPRSGGRSSPSTGLRFSPASPSSPTASL